MTADAPDIAEALGTIDRFRQEDQALCAVIAELDRRLAELAAEGPRNGDVIRIPKWGRN
jgi:hypothetical protein